MITFYPYRLVYLTSSKNGGCIGARGGGDEGHAAAAVVVYVHKLYCFCSQQSYISLTALSQPSWSTYKAPPY